MFCLAFGRSARDKMSVVREKLADLILDSASLIRDDSSPQIAAAVEQVSVESDRVFTDFARVRVVDE